VNRDNAARFVTGIAEPLVPHSRFLACALLAVLAAPRAFACSACGCTLDSDWAAQGLVASGGWRLNLRYDFFEQDQLRSGTDRVSPARFAYPADVEVQRYTINRNATLALDSSPNKDWGVNLSLPWYDRAHATIAAGDTELSTSHDRGVGDLRIVARYSGFAAQRSSGLLFGLKLPTGRFTDTFDRGPQRGATVDRGLQLGSGTVDAILGVYRFGAWSPDWGYFAQAIVQQPLDSREGFRPGTGVNLNFGLRYTASTTWVPQLQINARAERRERGVNADVANSGATLVYLSPGITWQPTRRFAAFAFVQKPVYQRVNGLQLEATEFVSLGLQYRL
jgi:hypothetical protein